MICNGAEQKVYHPKLAGMNAIADATGSAARFWSNWKSDSITVQ
jgi:hypothetical protein